MQNYVVASCNILHTLQEISITLDLLRLVRKFSYIPSYFCVISNEAVCCQIKLIWTSFDFHFPSRCTIKITFE